MRFSFQVGEQEKHQVEFSWGRFLGTAKIWIDGELVLKSRAAARDLGQAARLLTVTGSVIYLTRLAKGSGLPPRITRWDFEVGQQERHRVRIEKELPAILPALRANTYRIFVDDRQVGEYVG